MGSKLPFELNDVEFFLAVVQAGSLSGASRALKVAQPTVGRRIRQLEDALGARLFDRTPQGYAITAAGNRILLEAEHIHTSASVIARRASGDEYQLTGAVRITATEGFANRWLLDKLPVLHELYPDITLELSVSTSLADMLRLEADIALRIGTPGSEELVGRRVSEIGFGLYASAAYIEKFGNVRATSNLSGHQIIESSGILEDLVQAKELREMFAETAIALRTDSIMTQLRAAADGQGIAALAHYLAATEPALQRVLQDRFAVQRDLWMLTHRDLKFTARIRAVIDFLTAELAADAPLFGGSLTDMAAER